MITRRCPGGELGDAPFPAGSPELFPQLRFLCRNLCSFLEHPRCHWVSPPWEKPLEWAQQGDLLFLLQNQQQENETLQKTHTETSTQIFYMHAQFPLPVLVCFFFNFFFLLSWRERWEQSQEKQISPTIPFRKFHFKPNQMMAPALGYV